MLESHEDDITHWYFGDQKENLLDWLCAERILDEDDQGTVEFITSLGENPFFLLRILFVLTG